MSKLAACEKVINPMEVARMYAVNSESFLSSVEACIKSHMVRIVPIPKIADPNLAENSETPKME